MFAINNQSGFTLIELVIYLGITTGIIISLMLFSITIINGRNKNYAVSEVQANARVALELISQQIRNANNVNKMDSVFNGDPGLLSLSVDDPNKNPTVINLNQDDGILQIKQGVQEPVAVISQQVKITNLIFRALGSASKRENILIELTVAYNNSSSDINFNYNQSWRTAVSLRQ